MNLKLVGAYVAAVIGGLVALAAGLLVVLQWGNPCEFSLFGKNVKTPTALVMLGSIAFGAVLPYLVMLLWRSSLMIRRHRQAGDAVKKAAERAVRDTALSSAAGASGSSEKTEEPT